MTIARARTTIQEAAGGISTGENLATIFAAVPTGADKLPRYYASADAIETAHGYSPGVCKAATFIALTRLPILFVPLPISTEGYVGCLDQSGNTGTSVVSVAADTGGALDRVQGVVRVLAGGTVGTDDIRLEVSLDGGHIFKPIRIGIGTSYTIPKVGQVVTLDPGTLVTGDTVLTWISTPPVISDADLDVARQNLAAQKRQSRAWLLVKELSEEADISAFQAAVSAYDTTDDRPLQGLCYQRPNRVTTEGYRAKLSQVRNWMTGGEAITFAEVGLTGDTITRAGPGSFITDGFTAGDTIVVAGATDAQNNVTAVPDTIAALVLTLDTEDLVDKVEAAGAVSIYAAPTLTFSDTLDTLTINRGDLLKDGFAEGLVMTIVGTDLNDGDYPILSATADTITVAADSFADEVISSWGVSVTVSATYTADIAAQSSEFAPILEDYHLEIGYGELWFPSLVTGYRIRRPGILAYLCRIFQNDLSETAWHKDDGSLGIPAGSKFGNTDATGQPFEYDDRIEQAGADAGFITARTWASDSSGLPYMSRTITRNLSGGVLDQPAYARVGNLARLVIQAITENFTGGDYDTKTTSEGKFLTAGSISQLEERVDKGLRDNLLGLTRRGLGPRVEKAKWTASREDNLDPSAGTPKITGTCELVVRGIVFQVETTVRIS